MSKKSKEAFVCPLCQQNNACGNLAIADNSQSCWCNNPSIRLPKALLETVPEALRGKACICQTCALSYQSDSAIAKEL